MTHRPSPLKRILINAIQLTLIGAVILAAAEADAGKIDLVAGTFQMSAKNSRNDSESSLAGFGSYRIGYRRELFSRYEIDLGYSMLATKTVSGDLSFGLDLGVNYYPFTPAGDVVAGDGSSSAVYQSVWRPFAGVSFSQRNFQSTSAQYAGPGFKAGAERQIDSRLSGVGYVRAISLGGPNQSAALQIDLLIGGVYQF